MFYWRHVSPTGVKFVGNYLVVMCNFAHGSNPTRAWSGLDSVVWLRRSSMNTWRCLLGYLVRLSSSKASFWFFIILQNMHTAIIFVSIGLNNHTLVSMCSGSPLIKWSDSVDLSTLLTCNTTKEHDKNFMVKKFDKCFEIDVLDSFRMHSTKFFLHWRAYFENFAQLHYCRPVLDLFSTSSGNHSLPFQHGTGPISASSVWYTCVKMSQIKSSYCLSPPSCPPVQSDHCSPVPYSILSYLMLIRRRLSLVSLF